MVRTYTSYRGLNYTINDMPMHQGGEGSIHLVVENSRQKHVAKIYHDHKKAAKFYKKILFMVNNPPFRGLPVEISNTIVWPKDLLFSNGRFVGYIMPLVNKGIKLFSFIQTNFPKKKHGTEWLKFHRQRPDSIFIRMKICYNLAMAINLLHSSGKYVMVDMKPENILIRSNGQFSIIDIDSIQIAFNKRLLFPATAYTPEYAPHEFHNGELNIAKSLISKSFDNFSLSVILYQILLSIHPFQASHSKYTTLQENIQHGLYVHGSNKDQLFKIPTQHNRFNYLPKKLKALFQRALDHGFVNPNYRPRA